LDPLGHKQTDWTDAVGNRIEHDEYVGGAWSSATYAYDLMKHLTKATDPAGNATIYTVDSLGRSLGINDPDQGFWTYTYDGDDNILTETDALVTPVISCGYDALNRLTSKTTSGDGNTFTWTYDQAQSGAYNIGRLTTKADPYGSQTFAYDNMGHVTQTTRTTDGVNYPFSYTYDTSDRLLAESFPDGDSVGAVVYDNAGQLFSVPNILTSVAYDAHGRATSLVNANGTTQTRTYDANRFWVTGITTSNGSTNLQALTYGFDADGNRTSVTSSSSNNSDESWTYGYDELHRVTSAVDTSNSAYSQSFTFNAAGNIVSNSRVGSYTYPAQGAGSVQPHAVTTAGGNTYAYNANGQMTSRAGTALAWNGDHLMSNDGSNAYYYGGNRELLKLVNGGNTTRYLGDDFEVSASGTQNKFVMGLAVRVGTGSGNTRWMHSDFNDSLQVQSDGTGTESMRKTYYVTGDALSTTGTDSQSEGFTGQRQESSGLTYLHARFYDPLLGRFVSPDPMTPGHHGNAGLNRYAYAMNDFVNKEDTSGFMSLPCEPQCSAPVARAIEARPAPAPARVSYPTNSFLNNYARGPGGPVAYSQAYWYTYQPKPPPPDYGFLNRYAHGPGGPVGYSQAYWSQIGSHQAYFSYLDSHGLRGRLGRAGRCGCRPPPVYHARVSSPPQHHCAWYNVACHWRGAVQAAAVVVGAVAVSACIASVVCGVGAGIAIGAGAGMLSTTVNNLTSGRHVSIQQWIIGEAFSGGLGALTMGPFIPGPVGALGYYVGRFDSAAGDAISSVAVRNGAGIMAQAGKVGIDLGARMGVGYVRASLNNARSANGVGMGSAAYGAYLFFGR
jgi:RHS repeat-associated protein